MFSLQQSQIYHLNAAKSRNLHLQNGICGMEIVKYLRKEYECGIA